LLGSVGGRVGSVRAGFGPISEVAGFGQVDAREFDEVARFGWWVHRVVRVMISC
jgi:hypothetical protein